MDFKEELLAAIVRAQAAENARKRRDEIIARQTRDIAKLRCVIDELKQVIEARNTSIDELTTQFDEAKVCADHWYYKACEEQQAAGKLANELADIKSAIRTIREIV